MRVAGGRRRVPAPGRGRAVRPGAGRPPRCPTSTGSASSSSWPSSSPTCRSSSSPPSPRSRRRSKPSHAGASDYLSKPFRVEEIKIVVRRTLEARRLARENLQYREELKARYGFETLVGQSHQMVEIYKLVARVARLDTTVLIQGETGTGKELVARAIHDASAARRPPLRRGRLRGAARDALRVGAVRPRARRVHRRVRRAARPARDVGRRHLLPRRDRRAHRAAPGQAPPRRSRSATIRRVGGNDPIPVDVRVVAATNRDLRKLVAEGASATTSTTG